MALENNHISPGFPLGKRFLVTGGNLSERKTVADDSAEFRQRHQGHIVVLRQFTGDVPCTNTRSREIFTQWVPGDDQDRHCRWIICHRERLHDRVIALKILPIGRHRRVDLAKQTPHCRIRDTPCALDVSPGGHQARQLVDNVIHRKRWHEGIGRDGDIGSVDLASRQVELRRINARLCQGTAHRGEQGASKHRVELVITDVFDQREQSVSLQEVLLLKGRY